MAYVTMLEAAKNMPEYERAIVETYARSYHPMEQLAFADAPGGVIKWNLEDYIGDAAGNRTVNNDYTPNFAKKSPQAAAAGIYGGKIQIDHFTESMNPNEPVFQRLMRIKQMAKTFTQHFFEGSGADGQFMGLRSWIDANSKWSATQLIQNSTASTAGDLITLDNLDAACDLINIEPGKTFIYSSRVSRRAATKLARAANIGGGQQVIQYVKDEFGEQIMMYNGIPWITLQDGNGGEVLSQTESYNANTGGTAGSIYFVTFDEVGVHGAYLPHMKAGGGQFFIQEAVDGSNFDTDRMEWFPFIIPRIPRSVVRIMGVKQAVV